MAKYVNPTVVIDGALDKIALGNQLLVCSSQPTTRANALSSALASTSLISGDFTKANGDVSGRKITIAQKSNISVTATGTANHIAIVDATNLLLVTTCDPQPLTTGNTVTVPAFKDEIAAAS